MALLDLPTEVLSEVVAHLDRPSTALFALTNTRAYSCVTFAHSTNPVNHFIPTLSPARLATLRAQHRGHLSCKNQWNIDFLEHPETSTAEWLKAFDSFQTLVRVQGCEGRDCSFCPETRKFYKRSLRSSHTRRRGKANGCLAEFWRSKVTGNLGRASDEVRAMEKIGLEDALEENEKKNGSSSRVKEMSKKRKASASEDQGREEGRSEGLVPAQGRPTGYYNLRKRLRR